MKYINSEGSFDCIVTDPGATGWICESEDKGTPFVRVPVKVTEEGAESGSIGVWQGWLSNAAFENTVKRLAEVFGFNGDLAALATGKQTFTGRPCNVNTGAEEYNGKTRFKIKWLNAPGGGASAPKPIEQRKLDTLLGTLNKRAMIVAAEAKGQKPQQKEFHGEHSDEGLVPF